MKWQRHEQQPDWGWYMCPLWHHKGVKFAFISLAVNRVFAVVPTRSDRWLSPIVKLCFPAEASWLCWITDRRFLSHTALRKKISVWEQMPGSWWVGTVRVNAFPGMFTFLPGYCNSCRVWFSTLATFCSLQKKCGRRSDSAKAPSHTKCTSWINKWTNRLVTVTFIFKKSNEDTHYLQSELIICFWKYLKEQTYFIVP